jgi:hypothetical protein
MKTANEPTVDYSGYGQTEVSGGDLELLAGLAERQKELEGKISERQAEIKDLEAQVREISWNQIPELLDSLNMESFKLKDGSEIKVTAKLRLSIPKDPDRLAEVIKWIIENDGEYLIKEEFGFKFDKGQGDAANQFAAYCEKYPGRLNMAHSEGVETNSVKAFLKNKLEDGEEVPLAMLGGHRQTIAEITLPKKRGRR